MRLSDLAAVAVVTSVLVAQEQEAPPELRVGVVRSAIAIDGRFDEADWAAAAGTDAFRTAEPVEGGQPNGRTLLRVLADGKALYVGVRCFDPAPSAIVTHAVARDADLSSEDHVKIVLGTFLDGRTGYVFAVNPRGARYDALVASRGEDENDDWDGPWQARTAIDAQGWSVEMRLPIAMLSFAVGADVWHCNVERRVQRLLERSRWANPHRDQRVTNLGQAGHLVGMPRFDLGLGLAVRPAAVARLGKDSRSSPTAIEAEPSADVTWRITPEWTLDSFVQYDTESDSLGTNTRLRWDFTPESQLFFVVNSSFLDPGGAFTSDGYATTLKLQHELRF